MTLGDLERSGEGHMICMSPIKQTKSIGTRTLVTNVLSYNLNAGPIFFQIPCVFYFSPVPRFEDVKDSEVIKLQN